jgi:protein farnesyltransferase subunit beta
MSGSVPLWKGELGLFDDCGVPSLTSEHQKDVEDLCRGHFKKHVDDAPDGTEYYDYMNVKLRRDTHLVFLRNALLQLPTVLESLSASQPWLCYWTLHAVDLLGGLRDPMVAMSLERALIHRLEICKSGGAFAGDFLQMPHLATTYAAVQALAVLGTPACYAVIDRDETYRFLMAMKETKGSLCGGFRLHEGGEVDIRGTYCAIAVANLLNLLTPELAEGVSTYIMSCKTYEGGFGAMRGWEAHGGYTFCAVASLVILGEKSTVPWDDVLVCLMTWSKITLMFLRIELNVLHAVFALILSMCVCVC